LVLGWIRLESLRQIPLFLLLKCSCYRCSFLFLLFVIFDLGLNLSGFGSRLCGLGSSKLLLQPLVGFFLGLECLTDFFELLLESLGLQFGLAQLVVPPLEVHLQVSLLLSK
jgi:hypothetical protein